MAMKAGFWVGFFISLLAHEAGHVCMALLLGVRIKRIGLTWRGPYLVREQGTPAANALVSAAGPFVNLLLAALTWRSYQPFAFANLVLGLTNLLPTRNSDGSRILRAMKGDRQIATADVQAMQMDSRWEAAEERSAPGISLAF